MVGILFVITNTQKSQKKATVASKAAPRPSFYLPTVVYSAGNRGCRKEGGDGNPGQNHPLRNKIAFFPFFVL